MLLQAGLLLLQLMLWGGGGGGRIAAAAAAGWAEQAWEAYSTGAGPVKRRRAEAVAAAGPAPHTS